ncbi:hypothetical protein GDO81_019331 [Engystomops pustulosus]|uniref:Uncharacterized protein n=1 Tax=Engystomops pustulosus TaxID=76066 RepID=A0AAV6YKH8_ENGPU|nr:hypothetical protein GDO81_019331 [Engystomops pustulosus]
MTTICQVLRPNDSGGFHVVRTGPCARHPLPSVCGVFRRSSQALGPPGTLCYPGGAHIPRAGDRLSAGCRWVVMKIAPCRFCALLVCNHFT